jgi:hypothetical protein
MGSVRLTFTGEVSPHAHHLPQGFLEGPEVADLLRR